ncbi:cyclic-phosphate processing receiver domain-containing protein [Sphingobacterium sp. 1.A.4]|uniref:cyclic-phosphate processing receiver domain-containing protein n=1 Tax=Sphingobacterium sp. 1.A.4 TaxID=2044603 RepID=UPI000C0BF807|nr:cyclic-phosphate processing receiver domain-containing protein [Sphingobacterium sp. 1.A.4]
MKKLYLDDIRPIPNGYFGARSYAEFVKYIEKNGLPDFISFDHDLGLEKSGYDCAIWLVNYCMDNVLMLPDFEVHSQNPVGKENISSLLYNFKIKGYSR